MATKEEIINEVKKRGGTREEGERLYYRRKSESIGRSAESMFIRDRYPTPFQTIKDIFTGK